jgi:hypothetical protein
MACSVKAHIYAFVTSPLDEGKRMASGCGLFIPELLLRGRGHTVAQLVKALRYKLEGRGFDSL